MNYEIDTKYIVVDFQRYQKHANINFILKIRRLAHDPAIASWISCP